jgi:hypothetical protein
MQFDPIRKRDAFPETRPGCDYVATRFVEPFWDSWKELVPAKLKRRWRCVGGYWRYQIRCMIRLVLRALPYRRLMGGWQLWLPRCWVLLSRSLGFKVCTDDIERHVGCFELGDPLQSC